MRRRTLLGTVAGLSLAGLAGCSGDGGGDATGTDAPADGVDEIRVAPDNSLRFSPDSIAVTTGTTVTWHFDAPTHNVSCNPDHSSMASLPDGADPFASYDGDDQFATNDEGETFEHTFDVAGTYEYVCVPHAGSGMVGTVEVEE